SDEVPEQLDELLANELRLLGRVAVPKNLESPHKGLVQLLKQEDRRREKFANDKWAYDQPKFDTPLAKRRLRILNGVLLALSKRGHDGDVYENDGQIHARAIIGDTYIGLDLAIVGKYRTVRLYGYERPAPDLPTTTPLVLRVTPDFDRKVARCWRDDDEGSL